MMRKLYAKFAELGKGLLELNRSYTAFREDGCFRNAEVHTYTNDPAHPLDRAVRSCEYAYRIMFAGAFSGGKSTLINALMDHPDLLPTEDLPTPAS
jgi:polynucleotide 5'-kinase involved in rRNA processing